MKNNVQKRGAVYYFRRVVPKDIRHLFPTRTGNPRDEWVWSLKTKDYSEAKTLAARDYDRTSSEIAAARATVALSSRDIVSCDAAPANRVTQAEIDAMQLNDLEGAEYFARLDAENEARAEADPSFALELKLRAAKARELAQIERLEGEREASLRSSTLPVVDLMGLYDAYAAQPGRHPKTVAQWRPYISCLIDFLGHSNARAVTHDDMVAWRNYLRDDMEHKGKPLSAKTINGSYLGAASALFAWAKGDGLISKNPMVELTKVKRPSAPRTRSKGFSSEEALLILSATTAENHSREGQHLRDAKRWCPWLMAYSGARVNEITQLRKEDVFKTDGVHVLRITPDAGTVKDKEYRLVPLHSHLIEQGFLAFVSEKPDGPLFYDPKKRRSDHAINRQANRMGSKLATWVRSLGIPKEVMPNHAWRHNFAARAVRHGLDPRVTRAITGHAGEGVHEKSYLTDLPDFVDVLSRELEKLPNFEVGT